MLNWCRSCLWGDLTRTEIAEARDAGAIPVLPVGSIEQHSDHLPVDTDASSAFGVTVRAAERGQEAHVLVLPLQSFGFSPHHQTWPGTVSLSAGTLIALIQDVAESLYRTGFRRMLVVDGHGGNDGPLLAACNTEICRGIGLGLVHYFNPGRKDWLSQLAGAHRNLGHACTFETSIQMALRPGERERMQSRVQGLKPRLEPPFSAAGDLANLRESGLIWAWLFGPGDIGYYGDPAAALKGDPELILQLTVDALARFFDEYAAAKLRVGPSS